MDPVTVKFIQLILAGNFWEEFYASEAFICLSAALAAKPIS
jgi:hypothetical protein